LRYRRSTNPARPKPPLPEPPLRGRQQAHWQKHPTSGLILRGLRFLTIEFVDSFFTLTNSVI
ncbi:hypothetical protein PSI22_21095, partial [Xenorhabdus sp. XENO-7]